MAVKEEWREIAGYEGYYMVSSLGRVKGLDRLGSDGRRIKGKIRSTPLDAYGYPLANLWKDGKGHTTKVHRLVAAAFIPNPENKPCVNHIDGNPHNPVVENLEWVTYSENMIHANKTGLTPSPPTMIGESNCACKLSDEEVAQIRLLRETCQYSFYQLARMFGVSRPNIGYIINNKTRTKGSGVHVNSNNW